jgi:hypothetical protein
MRVEVKLCVMQVEVKLKTNLLNDILLSRDTKMSICVHVNTDFLRRQKKGPSHQMSLFLIAMLFDRKYVSI